MKKLFKLFLLVFLLLSDFIIFAQVGEESDGGDPLEDTGDPQPAAIDAKLIYLLLVGLLFAIYTIQKRRKRA